MSTHLPTGHTTDRLQLLTILDTHPADTIPCRAVDIHTATAWTADADDEQAVAAAACRAAPCPALTTCRAYGQKWTNELGTYGGLTERQRRQAARQNGAAA